LPNLSHCQNPFCLALQPQIREKLCTIAAMRTYQAKKTVIIEIGQHGHLFLITKGVAITIKQRPEGKQRGIECLEKGDIIGISNIFREEKDYAIFYTKKETTVCHFPTKDFGDLCSNFPELSCEVIRSLSHRFAQVVINLEHSTLDNSTEKMLYLIQKLSYEQTASSKQVFSFTHEELALLAGINRVTASRVIENLRQADYIIPLGKGKYRIIDHEDQYRQF
jgi:CRP-like cAMP-binding protein